MEEVSGETLEVFLLKEKVITPEDLEKVEQLRKQAKMSLEQVAPGITKTVDLETLGKIYQDRYSIPWIDLKSIRLDSKIVRMIPLNIMREHRLVAFSKTWKVFWMSPMLNPRDNAILDRLQIITGSKIQPYLADQRAVGSGT